MNHPQSRFAVVTGGTDGIGAATARALRAAGADVVIVGRSQEKAAALLRADKSHGGTGSMSTIVADLAEMKNVITVVDEVADRTDHIDLLVHAAGILITRTEHTTEGIEKDFAVGYLSRFVFLEHAARRSLLSRSTRMVNIAASAPTIPWYARMEFSSQTEVEARVGMRSHGQAQLANDLLTAQAPTRYGITAIGYGPGAVNTSIRREVPHAAQAIMKPFYARVTRQPEEVGAELLAVLLDPAVPAGSATIRNRKGTFPAAAYVADPARQHELIMVSEALAARALGS